MPDCKPVKGQIWYPSEENVIFAHDRLIEQVGGWSGFEVGMAPYATFLKEVKAARGIYRKGAVLMKSIATSRMFQDGHHRTAFVVTQDFLEYNGAEFKEKDLQKVSGFIKNIRTCSINEIASWLEYGSKEKSK